MALTKEQLIGVLQNEVRILQHLCTKVSGEMLNYRPAPKQRSTMELLRYLTVMGPALTPACQTGTFDEALWGAKSAEAEAMDLDGVVKSLASQAGYYAETLGAMSEEDFARQVELFGQKGSTGTLMVNLLVCGHAAYRMQLFLYLKASGREELNTLNLWGGVDGSM